MTQSLLRRPSRDCGCNRSVAVDTGRSLAARHLRSITSGSGVHVAARFIAAVSVLPVLTSLAHPCVATYTNAASLFSHSATELSALIESRKLFGTVHNEGPRLDRKTVGDVSRSYARWLVVLSDHFVLVLFLFEFFVQIEAQAVFAFVSYREIRKQEVAGRMGAVKIHQTRDGCTSQDRCATMVLWHTSLRNGTSLLKGNEKEIICVHGESDVCVGVLAFEDFQFHDRRRVDRTTVSG